MDIGVGVKLTNNALHTMLYVLQHTAEGPLAALYNYVLYGTTGGDYHKRDPQFRVKGGRSCPTI